MDENSYKSYRFRLRLLFGLFCLCMALYGLVMYQAQVVQADTYKGVLPLFITMMIYFFLTFTLTRILNHFEKKFKHA